MPKYRIVYFTPGSTEGVWFRTVIAKDDEDMAWHAKNAMQQRAGWRVEVWRPDRKLLVATFSGPPLVERDAD